MSADNWDTCPQCKRNAESEHERLIARANQLYGSVSADEYMGLRKKADAKTELGETLREDYEVGVDEEGEFYIKYSGSCSVCGFAFKYNYTEQVKLK